MRASTATGSSSSRLPPEVFVSSLITGHPRPQRQSGVRQCPSLEIYVLPLERQELSGAQPREGHNILCRERLALHPVLLGKLNAARRVPRYEVPIYGLRESLRECRVNVAHRARRVAFFHLLVDEPLDVQPSEVLQPYAPNGRLEVEAHVALVIPEGGVPDRPLHGVLQPKVEVRTNGELLRVEVQPLLEVLEELVALLEDVLLPLRVEALPYWEARGRAPLPATVGPLPTKRPESR